MIKTETILAFILAIIFSGCENKNHTETTAIPDANFEQALIVLGYDSGEPDGEVLTSTINKVDSLSIVYKKISDLTGIEDFTSLVYFNCSDNDLTNIDLSNNTELVYLDCSVNDFAETGINLAKNEKLRHLVCGLCNFHSLDLTHNIKLTSLNCPVNQLTNLDLSKNKYLTDLNCFYNPLTKLDLSHNIALTFLCCDETNIDSLDFSKNTNLSFLSCGFSNYLIYLNVKNGNNTKITDFSTYNTANLYCIQVDDVAYAESNWISIDKNNTFSTNCDN